MAVNEETSIFGMEQGCAVHGDEHMRECSMCGAEFCRICFPRSAVCPDCADQSDDDDDEEESGPDFDDVSNLGELLDDEDIETEEDDEEIPPEDLVDDEDDDRF